MPFHSRPWNIFVHLGIRASGRTALEYPRTDASGHIEILQRYVPCLAEFFHQEYEKVSRLKRIFQRVVLHE